MSNINWKILFLISLQKRYLSNRYYLDRDMVKFHFKFGDFTCNYCIDYEECEYSYDIYNTYGDCIALK